VSLFSRLEVEPAAESFHTALGVHNALLAREEGMAGTADLHLNPLFGGTGGKSITANADDLRVGVVLWVYINFHITVS
jgi:hypothetical protein